MVVEIQKQGELERYFHGDWGWQVRERCLTESTEYRIAYALIDQRSYNLSTTFFKLDPTDASVSGACGDGTDGQGRLRKCLLIA